MNQLLDAFHRQHNYLRISVTDRCNLRCHYCMPAEGIMLKERTGILNFDEIVRLTRIFAGMGVKKVRLTGGEPLVRRNLPDLIARLAEIPHIKTVGMTTNGVLLPRYVAELKTAGLSRLNVSLDSLRPERFAHISRRPHFHPVMKGIQAALDAGFSPLKINTVVMRGINDDELLDFVELVRNNPLNIRFIEYMPFKSNNWKKAGFIPYQEMKARISHKYSLRPGDGLTGNAPGVARDYRIPGFRGQVSFISPISKHFCDSCSRLRLTAEGSLKTCLFSAAEVNLRDAIREGASNGQIQQIIQNGLQLKPWAHPSTEELLNTENRTMTEIGG